MTDKFKRGDIVMLISGGPAMTVATATTATTNIEAVWFDNTGHIKNWVFPEDLLVKVDQSQNLDVSQSPPEKKEFRRMSDASKPEPCPVCSVTNGISKRRCANITCPYAETHNPAV